MNYSIAPHDPSRQTNPSQRRPKESGYLDDLKSSLLSSDFHKALAKTLTC